MEHNQCPSKQNKRVNRVPLPDTKYFVDVLEQVVIKKKHLVKSDPRYPTIDLYDTEYNNMFVTSDLLAKFRKVQNIDFINPLHSKLEYAFYPVQKEMTKQSMTTRKD